MTLAVTTGPISAGGVLTAAAPTGTIPGGSGAQMTLFVQYASSGFSYQFVYFGGLTTNFPWTFTGGSSPTGLTTGVYTNVAATSLNGVATGVKFQVSVSGGVITSIVATSPGTNVVNVDTFSFSLTPMGGTGNCLININFPSSSLANPGTLLVDAYGTGGTSGTGGAGTYQTAVTGLLVQGAALDPNAQLANGYLSIAEWQIYQGSTPPSTSLAPVVAPNNFDNPPILPGLNVLADFESEGPALEPPPPLPQTATGSNTTTSYSS